MAQGVLGLLWGFAILSKILLDKVLGKALNQEMLLAEEFKNSMHACLLKVAILHGPCYCYLRSQDLRRHRLALHDYLAKDQVFWGHVVVVRVFSESRDGKAQNFKSE